MGRVYLDHNATTPLHPEARDAMIAAMDVYGNPSSVHAEGRASKALIETARSKVAAALGADGADVIFVSSATEGAALFCSGRHLSGALVEHDAVGAWINADLPVDKTGRVHVDDPGSSVLQLANSETGIVQDIPEGLALSDMTQAFGKLPLSFNWTGVTAALVSAHKLGGPKGIGALVIRRGTDIGAQLRGGGQEMGRRAGTENVIGIAGFGAAAEAAARDLAAGAWARIEALRDKMEAAIAAQAPETVFTGQSVQRLPNTSCFATPGWKGETQVMQMDLSGFAISAGSACSSGKVRASKVLTAMGYGDDVATGAIRVSLGLETTEDDVMRFAENWLAKQKKFTARAA
ncbi:Cysteine desulfurase [Thalassovita gelatinovora]|uniref:Cysteine desulfurase n=1 Tax=Thalassovita gelatinovora TaxID=53501 RepID=A0A0P1FNV0_THAGE|nr:cysteine desulfurase family protein [Thalassovita gelatinovora]QIZ79429.1 cysteine desulfurase [Thalassovita gelatinovora]CUH62788.1 Cysteine desulfurase [Thalassovita gelatinovora]SEQ10155.1 cysteine desulfurase [Thalassovita gelatinovora]